MSGYQLQIKLLSDTTFGRGDGVPGLIDQEVEHDRYGLPYLRGRTLKGLISEECDNLIACLPQANQSYWRQVACQLFGKAGSGIDAIAKVHFGDACLPLELRTAIAHQIETEQFTRSEILESLTTIRRQTAINAHSGVASEGSLRSLRVALRELVFTSELLLNSDLPEDKQEPNDLLVLLMAGTASLRYVGSGRNRGRGHVQCTLLNESGKPPSTTLDSFFDSKKVSPSLAEVS